MIGTDVIDTRAREILNDATEGDAESWSDANLIAWINDGTREIVDFVPESLLTDAYTLGTLTEITALANTISISNRYRSALTDYVCYRALGQEGQDERDRKRSNDYYEQFTAKAGIPVNSRARRV